MIDLRNKSLPKTITVEGRDFLIETDFRAWLEFSELIKTNRQLSDYIFLFKDEFPIGVNFFPQLVEFYINPNSTPNSTGGSSGDVAVDYVQDGEYIYAGFMQAYGINLLDCDLHWHQFKALFVGLPDDTKIKQIMSMRTYRKDTKSYEKKCRENKTIWTLPKMTNQEKEEILADINALFYNSVKPHRRRNKNG